MPIENPSPQAEQGGALFTRKATGLVREVGSRDAFLLNLFWINLFVGILIVTQAPAIFPGVSMWAGFLLTTALLVVPMLVYAFLSAAMPRAGGDYVYISRVIHPVVGFVCGLAFTIMITLFLAIFAALVSLQCISTVLGTLGTVGSNDTLLRWATDVTSDDWRFAIGTASIVFAVGVNLFGLRPLMIMVRIFFAIAIAGIVTAIVLMLTTSPAEFAKDFAQYGSVVDVVNAAKTEGLYDPAATGSFGDMLAFLALGFTVLALSQFPAYAAGELRKPRKTTLYAVLGGLVAAGALFALLAGLASHTFGDDFLGSMTALFNAGSESYPALPAPFLFLYTGLLTDSPVLAGLMSVGILLSFLAAMAMLVMVASRNLLAYSLDGAMPAKLRQTDSRWHAPRYAIAACGVVAILFYIPYTYAPAEYFDFLFSGALLLAIVFTVTMLSAVLFPMRLPSTFEGSPYNQRVAGIPLVSLLGLAGLVIYGWWVIVMITDDRIGANATPGLVGVAVVFAIAAAWWVGAWLVNRSRGVDLMLRHRELPPE
jgi:amino acid transporter